MNAPGQEGKISGPTPEELAIANLTASAVNILDTYAPARTSMPDGSSSRGVIGGNFDEILELQEVISSSGARSYVLETPQIVSTSGGGNWVRLKAAWTEDGNEVDQTIVSGDKIDFEKVGPDNLAKTIELHLGKTEAPGHERKVSAARRLVKRIFSKG